MTFRSVATVAGPRAVGALLTGMGRDGAAGLLAMRRAGAFTIGQDEPSSVVWGMPAAAQALDAVDVELPLPEIAGAIVAAARRVQNAGGETGCERSCRTRTSPRSRSSCPRGRARLRREPPTRAHVRRGRAARVPARATSPRTSRSWRPEGAEERQRLLDGVTIQETHFYRNGAQIDALRQHLLPDLLHRAAAEGRPLRIWSAGCSTGEEPYTLAMLALESAPRCASTPTS